MKQQFLDTMDTHLKRAVQPQIMPENTLNTILTITGKYNTAKYARGVYRHPGSKQIASNTIAQAMLNNSQH
jgi:hypothetical protein